MELIVLGSGCFAPPLPGKGAVRHPSGYALSLPRETLLFDFGFGNLRQLVKAGVSPSSVSHLFLTHFHLDHFGELPGLLFYFRYDAKPAAGRLRVVGPPGLKKRVRALRGPFGAQVEPRGYKLELIELPPGRTFEGPGWRVASMGVPHFIPAQAYRFEGGGKSFAYSGDTAYCEPLADFAAESDLFVLECSQPSSAPLPQGHLTPPEALKLAERSRCRRVLLSHLSAASAREAARLLRGRRKFRLARDLMRARL